MPAHCQVYNTVTLAYLCSFYTPLLLDVGGDGSIFNFANNQLATFNEDVFYPVLLQMNTFSNAYLDVTGQQRMLWYVEMFIKTELFCLHNVLML